ncbi:carboxysome shell carbonic anhydrase [Marichromatium sp. PS1]|uniref:carboxysome shell carbonic anhydrase n=1 Tax=Marichromatium sp. PS1 TaxID=3138932 RepID=UPI0032E7A6DD
MAAIRTSPRPSRTARRRAPLWRAAPPRQPLTSATPVSAVSVAAGPALPSQGGDKRRLGDYERRVRQAFAAIESALRQIAALPQDAGFVRRAQHEARSRLGFELPVSVLERAWIGGLDMRALFAHASFATVRALSDDYFLNDPLGMGARAVEFERFLLECGFHAMSLTPCSDGRLAHVIGYVLRLPMGVVRRKAHAGALFDVEEAVRRWTETELRRHREGVPNTAEAPTRYLKVVAYHYSSRDPAHQGCAAHGSDDARAAAAGLAQLRAFREAIENSYCCGASIDILLIGIDTDTDRIRVHLTDAAGEPALERHLDSGPLHAETRGLGAQAVRDHIRAAVAAAGGASPPAEGMQRLVARLIEHNLEQLDYVRAEHGGQYPDAGHQERFIGVGGDLAEVQLRNLTFFAFMRTLEEGAADLDIGIDIFRRLNLERGLPIPVVVRFDYPGRVPGARARAAERCARVVEAITRRYPELVAQGLLHTWSTVRDSDHGGRIESVGGSLSEWEGL